MHLITQPPIRQAQYTVSIYRFGKLSAAPSLPGERGKGPKIGRMRGLHRRIRPIFGYSHALRALYLCAVIFLVSCGRSAPLSTPQLVNVYATAAAQPWLADTYACAEQTSAIVNLSNPQSADIVLQIGEPKLLTTPAYQIEVEDILIVTHRESPVQNLSLEEVRLLFAGQGDPSLQVWVYAENEDVQRAFERAVMSGRPVTSLARLATGPQQMSDILNAEKNAVGILPRRWKIGNTREVLIATTVPVLAVTASESKEVVSSLLACLQK